MGMTLAYRLGDTIEYDTWVWEVIFEGDIAIVRDLDGEKYRIPIKDIESLSAK